MKILFGFIVLLCTLVFATHHYDQSLMEIEPEGFRGIPWHAEIIEEALELNSEWELVKNPIGEHASCKVYERKSERLLFGDAEIDSVFYSFQEDTGFVSAAVYFEERKNFELIREICIEHWGEPAVEKTSARAPEESDADVTELCWRGKKVDTTIWYACKSGIGALHIYLKESNDAAMEDCEILPQYLRSEQSFN